MYDEPAQAAKQLTGLGPPEYTCLGHAVRWVAHEIIGLSYEDRIALGDRHHPIGCSACYQALYQILLALRNGTIRSVGKLTIVGAGAEGYFESKADPDVHWDEFLSRFEADVAATSGNVFAAPTLMDIPGPLWSKSRSNVASDTLRYVGAASLHATFTECSVSSGDLFQAFDPDGRPSTGADLKNDELHPKEREKAELIVQTLATEFLEFDPSSERSSATQKIVDLVERRGGVVHPQTVRKFLRPKRTN